MFQLFVYESILSHFLNFLDFVTLTNKIYEKKVIFAYKDHHRACILSLYSRLEVFCSIAINKVVLSVFHSFRFCFSVDGHNKWHISKTCGLNKWNLIYFKIKFHVLI